MKLLFFIASLLGALAVPTGKAVFFGPGKANITFVDNLNGTVTASLAGTFDLTGQTIGQSDLVYLSYNYYAPLPISTAANAANSTLGPQYNNFTLTANPSTQVYTFGGSTFTFQGNLTSAEYDNILGTSVSVMIGSTIYESAVIGAANTEAFSDIELSNFTAPGDSGNLAGAIITSTNLTSTFPRGVIYFTPGPNKTIGGEVIPTVKVTLFVDAGVAAAGEKWAVHVHQYGFLDNSQGNGLTTGLHFNPLKNPHGNLYLGQSRHVGDMGNFTLDSNGQFAGVYYAENMNIYGKNSIMGRGIIVHKLFDNANFNFTKYHRISYDIGYAGAAGARLGQGVIGAANNFSTTPITSDVAFGIQNLLPTSDNSACLGLPVGQQRRYILNVVSASVVGTAAGKLLASNPAAWGVLFPVGFDWTNGKAFDGLVNNAVTKSFFNGVALNSADYVSPLAYTPQINTACNVTSKFDYTGTFLAYVGNSSCDVSPALNLIYHLVDGVGTSLKCAEFAQTQQDYEMPRYLQSYVSETITDVLAFQAQYHRNMGLSKAVMDQFVGQVGAALNAHGVAVSAYTPLVEAINTYYYAGTYGLVNVNSTECPNGWSFSNLTAAATPTGCIKNAAGALTVSLSVIVAFVASMLF